MDKFRTRAWPLNSAGNLIFGLLALLLAISLLGLAFPNAAFAQTNRLNGPPRNVRLVGFTSTTLASTFATTSYADMASVTFTPVNDPNATNVAGGSTGSPYEHIQVTWMADVSKATATTGTCALYVNGAVVASSARTASSSGGNENIGGVIDLANTVTGSQAVKLQCKSGDTNTFTVNQVSLLVNEAY